MENRRLKKSVVYALYAIAFITLIATVYLLDMGSSPKRFDAKSSLWANTNKKFSI